MTKTQTIDYKERQKVLKLIGQFSKHWCINSTHPDGQAAIRELKKMGYVSGEINQSYQTDIVKEFGIDKARKMIKDNGGYLSFPTFNWGKLDMIDIEKSNTLGEYFFS